MLVACCDQKRGNLDVALLEDDLALLAADDRRPQVPLHLVERVHTFFREEAFVFQAGDACRRTCAVSDDARPEGRAYGGVA